MNKLTIDEIGYLEEIRKRMGFNENDKSMDKDIEEMTPMERSRLVIGWYLGDGSWADTCKQYFESQGLYLTTNPEADGIIY